MDRRGRGSGGIQQPDKARRAWRIWWDAPPGPGGKRRRRSEIVRGSRNGAEKRLREVLSSIDDQTYVERAE